MRATCRLRRTGRQGAARAGLPQFELHLERRAHSRAPKSSSAAWASCEGSEIPLPSSALPRSRSSSCTASRVQRDLMSSSEHCSPDRGRSEDHLHRKLRSDKPIFGSKRTALQGFPSPTTCPRAGSDQRRAFLTRLSYAFRFSQPLDVLFRLRHLGLVSCRIRPWG